MEDFFSKLKERFSDDRGDSNTVSQLLWIVGAVVVVGAVGSLVYQGVKNKGEKMKECLENSNNLFTGTDGENCGNN